MGGYEGPLELQPPPLERSVSVPGPCTPFGLWHQLCEPASWSVSAGCGLFPQTPHSPQDPGPRPRRPCFPFRWSGSSAGPRPCLRPIRSLRSRGLLGSPPHPRAPSRCGSRFPRRFLSSGGVRLSRRPQSDRAGPSV